MYILHTRYSVMVVNFNTVPTTKEAMTCDFRKTGNLLSIVNIRFERIANNNNNKYSYVIIGHTTNGGRWSDDETGYLYASISPVGVSRIAGQVKVYPWITSLLYYIFCFPLEKTCTCIKYI